MSNKQIATLVAGPALAALALVPAAASAQDVNLNYDRLSSLEEPIAAELGDVTVSVTGVADVPIIGEFDNLIGAEDDEVTVGFVSNIQVAAETQLANRWTVGAVYFGQYATDPLDGFNGADDYSDNVAGFVATSFGTVLGGNVNQQVRELTRRQRGVGNGFLAFDDFYGGLDNWGGAYLGRFGPSVVGAVVDENGDFEVGAQFQRPIGERDIRFTGRYREGRFVAADGLTQFETQGVGAVGEIVHGSSLFDLGAGYERLESALTDIDRWYLSAGAQTQLGPIRFSAEGHYGQVDGNDEMSAALGASYAIARGLSFNLGVNAEEARVNSDGVDIIQTDELTAVSSLRFSF